MKTLILLLASCFAFYTTQAQIEKAKEVSVDMSNGKQMGWKILIPAADAKMSQKQWAKLMRAYDAKTAKVKKQEEYMSELAMIPSLSEREINVYAQFDETPEGTYLIAFFDLGGAYLNSNMHKDLVKPLQKLMQDFAKEVAVDAIEAKLASQEKVLKKLEGEQKRLKSDESTYEQDIKDCEEKIEQRKKDIETNRQDQEKKAIEISEQLEAVNEVKDQKKKFK